MPAKPPLTVQNAPQGRLLASLSRYGGVLLLLAVFVIFIVILLLSSFSGQLGGDKCVAVVNIDGEITTASSPQSLFSSFSPGSEDIAATVSALNKRNDVGAVVFVINSPGGGVVASREIYQAVKALDKPKVAYFREVAASGAYYVATGTDYIVSEPLALTGSIGVIMTIEDLSGLFGKLGVNTTVLKSGEVKDMGSMFRPTTDKEKAILDAIIEENFLDFKNTVIANRGSRLDMAKFNEILDARILSGNQAKGIGLVDAVGNKQDAINKAASLANITAAEPRICKIDVKPAGSQGGGLFDFGALVNLISGEAQKKVSVKYE